MNHHERLDAELRTVLDRFNSTAPMARLHAGEVGVGHFAAHLRQNYFQLRERPVLMALAASRLKMSHEVAKLLHKRAVEEIGHDQLALNDLAALGVDVSGVPDERPLPETAGLLAWGHYQILRVNPVSFIGSMYFLDFAPMHAITEVAESLERAGVPREAMSSLHDHEVVGPIHKQAMASYVDELVRDAGDLDVVLYGMQTTARLYVHMIGAAFELADTQQ